MHYQFYIITPSILLDDVEGLFPIRKEYISERQMSDLEPGQVLKEVIEKKRIFYGQPLIPLSDHFVTEQQRQ